ncbi:hypothetical protein J6590_052984 [Homalodisca vitripennis]|nr:hypothetical protein J6590_052984 [Homalodisca vitripennis]
MLMFLTLVSGYNIFGLLPTQYWWPHLGPKCRDYSCLGALSDYLWPGRLPRTDGPVRLYCRLSAGSSPEPNLGPLHLVFIGSFIPRLVHFSVALFPCKAASSRCISGVRVRRPLGHKRQRCF